MEYRLCDAFPRNGAKQAIQACYANITVAICRIAAPSPDRPKTWVPGHDEEFSKIFARGLHRPWMSS